MAGAGYHFTFFAPRATLWAALVGAVGALAAGTALVAAAISLPTQAAGAAVLAGAVLWLRRALLYAHECRVGEAGILIRTLLREESFIPWSAVRAAHFSGGLARVTYIGASKRWVEFWLRPPRGHRDAMLRLETFVKSQLAARARADARAETTPPPEPAGRRRP